VPPVTFGSRPLRKPVVVALVNDFELVVRGLATMLRPYRDRIQVVELDLGRNPEYEVDVALFDAYGHAQLGLDRVGSLVHAPNVDAVAVYTSAATAEQRDAALAAGARGVLSKSIHADELADAILSVASGQEVVSDEFGEDAEPRWPGHEFGLTSRESEVAAQLTQGKTNKDIAAALWISENTVKTHLKSIFQKTTATSRSQAIVRLAGEFGFARRSA
jgi:DNA-binding NarL/FixJ family response regulator